MTQKQTSSKVALKRQTDDVKVMSSRIMTSPVDVRQRPIVGDWKDDVIQYYRDECSTAWKCFLAAAFERYIFALEFNEKERHLAALQEILEFPAHLLTEEEKCNLAIGMGHEFEAIAADIKKHQELAGERYVKALNSLNAGHSIESLPKIDPNVSCDYFMGLVREGTVTPPPSLVVPEEDGLNLSFASSIASEESGFATARSTLEESSSSDLMGSEVPAVGAFSNRKVDDLIGKEKKVFRESGKVLREGSETSSIETKDSGTQLGPQKKKKKRKKNRAASKPATKDGEFVPPEEKSVLPKRSVTEYGEKKPLENIGLPQSLDGEHATSTDDVKEYVNHVVNDNREKMRPSTPVEEKGKPSACLGEKMKPSACVEEKVKPSACVEEKVKPSACVEEKVKLSACVEEKVKLSACVEKKVKLSTCDEEKVKPPVSVEEKMNLDACVEKEAKLLSCVEEGGKSFEFLEENRKSPPHDEGVKLSQLNNLPEEPAIFGAENGFHFLQPSEVEMEQCSPPEVKKKPPSLKAEKLKPPCSPAERNGRAASTIEVNSFSQPNIENVANGEQDKECSPDVASSSSSGDSTTAASVHFQHDVDKQIEEDERIARQLAKFWEYADAGQKGEPKETGNQSKVVAESSSTSDWTDARPTLAARKSNSHVREQNGQHLTFNTREPVGKFFKQSALNKTSMCWAYRDNGVCPWGDACIFAHGSSELRPFPEWFAANGNHPNDLIPPKPKVATAGHSEPCDDQYCFARLQFYLHKTTICKQWLAGRCKYNVKDCKFAHGAKDRKPLPKHEMCEKYRKGKCRLAATECVYAHSPAEYRPLKKGSVGKSKAVPTRRPSTTASNVAYGDLDNCIICYEEFKAPWDKCRLDCGHDSFHRRCIQQWIEREKSCPFCRKRIETTDSFVTSGAANSHDYPPLFPG